jgi:hypothetical protein
VGLARPPAALILSLRDPRRRFSIQFLAASGHQQDLDVDEHVYRCRLERIHFFDSSDAGRFDRQSRDLDSAELDGFGRVQR